MHLSGKSVKKLIHRPSFLFIVNWNCGHESWRTKKSLTFDERGEPNQLVDWPRPPRRSKATALRESSCGGGWSGETKSRTRRCREGTSSSTCSTCGCSPSSKRASSWRRRPLRAFCPRCSRDISDRIGLGSKVGSPRRAIARGGAEKNLKPVFEKKKKVDKMTTPWNHRAQSEGEEDGEGDLLLLADNGESVDEPEAI